MTTIIIPARLQSTRLSEKLLRPIQDKPVIQWVYEACSGIKLVKEVIIATDHPKIKEVAESFGARALLTKADHQSGTDRCAEIANQIDSDIIINVQGDEPFISPGHLIEIIESFEQNPKFNIVTLFEKISPAKALLSGNVKLVKDIHGKILYFSRSPIPYDRNKSGVQFYKHLGIYGFRKATLLKVSRLKPTVLEISERLEQLRWLENGLEVHGIEVDGSSISIDTPEDLDAARLYAEGLSR